MVIRVEKAWLMMLVYVSAIAATVLLCLTALARADMASPHIFHEIQPDGTVIALHIRGSHALHWLEDLNGYTVVRERPNSGPFVYAKQGRNGHLIPTVHEVGKDNPQALGLQRRVLPSTAVQELMRIDGPAGQTAEENAIGQPDLGPGQQILNNLVVLVRFKDHTGRTLPSKSDIDVLMNTVGGDPFLAPTGSLKDIYLINSHGALTINSTVVAWATVSNTEEYYANGASGRTTRIHQALGEALDIVDSSVDFDSLDQDSDGYIDAVTFLHSGYGAEWGGTDADGTYYIDRIWSHKWALYSLPGGSWQSDEGVQVYTYQISPSLWGTWGNEIGRIGVIAHEMGHILGLPDLYDTDNSPGNGIGSWGLMANSWGSDGTQQPPPLMSAWSKIKMGWITPTELSVPGHYTLGESFNSDFVYKIADGYPEHEYLLIENRRRKNASNAVVDNIPSYGDGLVIYHIDDSTLDYNTEGYPGQTGWPENGNHYSVAVLQADGNYNLEKGDNRGDNGDAYRSGFVSRIGPTTIPSSDSYQDGIVYTSGYEISEIGTAGTTMEFDFNTNIFPHIEIIIDNKDAGFASGPSAWPWSQFTPGGYNVSYQYAPTGSGSKWAKWTFTVNTPGEYEIFAQWTSGDNRSPAAPYTIKNGANTWTVTANQTRDGAQFNLLGTHAMAAGTVEVVLKDTPTGVVIADAVKIVSEGTPPVKSLDRIEIEGLSSIAENTTQFYVCRAHYTDGTNEWITADSWAADCAYADIDGTGSLTAYEVDGDMTCRITASYTADGITKTASKDIAVIDDDTPVEPIEIIIDNKDAGFASGPSAWTWSQFTPGGYNVSYQYAATGNGSKWAKWTFTVSTPGEYEVFAQWTSGDNRSPAAPYTIKNGANTWTVTANQTRDGGRFNLLGTYPFAAGTLEVVLNDTPTGVVIADAVKIVSEGAPVKLLDRIEIEGLASISENTSQNYLCRAHYTDGTTDLVIADAWSDDCVDADIDDTGLLTAYEVDGDMTCRITADYTAEGITKAASKDVTIIDDDSIKPIEIIIDNKNAGFASGPTAWTWSQFTPGGYNTSYQYAPIGSGSKWAEWTFTVSTPGEYEVFAQWTSGDNRSPAAPYTIKNGVNTWAVTANQTRDGGKFNLLGAYPLAAGTVEVMLNDTPTGVVIADAVKIMTRPQ